MNKATLCQSGPSLPRKEIVKNIALCDASQIFFSIRVAPGFCNSCRTESRVALSNNN